MTMLLRGHFVSSRLARPSPVLPRCRTTLTVRAVAAVDTSKRVRYAKRPDQKDSFYYTVPPPETLDKITNLEPQDVAVELKDLRVDNNMRWHRNGFELVQFPGAQDICWDDKEQVKQVYYPEVEALLKRTTGASRVRIIAHGLRRGKTPKGELDLRKAPGFQEPSTLTHVDFTDSSGPPVMRALMGKEAEELSKKPWGIIQVWRPIAGPVQDSPLGMVDTTTMSQDDLVPTPLHLPGGYKHEINFISHNPNHRWFWTSQMRTDEAYVFVNYDSRTDGRPRFTPHAAIVDPDVPADAPIRESAETRALVFWD